MDNCSKCGLDLHGALSVTREFIAANLYVNGHYSPEGVWIPDLKMGTRPLPSPLVADGGDFCNTCGEPVIATLKL
jgi:hypothetical protein